MFHSLRASKVAYTGQNFGYLQTGHSSVMRVRPAFSAFFAASPQHSFFSSPSPFPLPLALAPLPAPRRRRARNLINAMFTIIIPVTIFWQDKVFRSTNVDFCIRFLDVPCVETRVCNNRVRFYSYTRCGKVRFVTLGT